jgi:hypothetical protein
MESTHKRRQVSPHVYMKFPLDKVICEDQLVMGELLIEIK